MMITRRDLLKSGLALAPTILLWPSAWRTLNALTQSSPVIGGRTLVIIQMAGGNDGLNTVIPYSDPLYYSYRPSLAIPKDQAIVLNADTGLHPGWSMLKPLWDAGALAIVEGVEYPNPSYSHFDSMQIWQTADPLMLMTEGWLGRYLDTQVPIKAAFPGLAVESKLPPELYSPTVIVPAAQSVAAYQFTSDPLYPVDAQKRLASLSSLYAAASGSPQTDYFDNTMNVTNQSIQALQTANKQYKSAVTYPATSFAASLKLLAEAITSGLGVGIGHVSIGSFDTHANELSVQGQLLTTMAEGLSAFYQDLKANNVDNNVVIMTWSEFGRRVAGNASGGTDHGSAAPMFVMGTPVVGGFFGRRPDLGNLNSGNLVFTTDFRSVYATILEKWLGAPSAAILGSQFATIPFLT